MHEMSLSMNTIDMVVEQAEKQGCRRVTAIWLEVGAVSCIEPETIQYCIEIAARETIAAGCLIHIIKTAAKAWCLDCKQTIELQRRVDGCPLCGGFMLKLTQGDELRIKTIEVE